MLIVTLAVSACSGASKPAPAPAGGDNDRAGSGDFATPPGDGSTAGSGSAAPTTCAGPPPSPTHKCVRDCGGPVVRDGDPPPGWSWLSADLAKNREQYGCPICLPPTTLIATPSGAREIRDFAIGDPIITLTADGARLIAHVVHVGSTPVAGTHRMQRITLSDGRIVAGSAGHPDRLGRALGDLRTGDLLDGAIVQTVEDVPFSGDRTWDLLPSGPTGVYLADGVVLRSTFFRTR